MFGLSVLAISRYLWLVHAIPQGRNRRVVGFSGLGWLLSGRAMIGMPMMMAGARLPGLAIIIHYRKMQPT